MFTFFRTVVTVPFFYKKATKDLRTTVDKEGALYYSIVIGRLTMTENKANVKEKSQADQKIGYWNWSKYCEKKTIKIILIKSFWKSGRGWQPRPIKEGIYVFLFSPMTNDK